MYKHALRQLTARIENGAVRLSFYLTEPVFRFLGGQKDALAIRIHRKRISGFQYGQHYAEHFDGLVPAAKDILFEGSMELINHGKVEFLDLKVNVGGTYVYWVSCPALGRLPTGPAPVRVRDRGIWWPHRDVERRLAALARDYPGVVSLKKYGTTVGGHAIPGLIVGNRRNCLALVGTLHAGESGPELMIPAVERLLADKGELLGRTGLAILPNVNVDERERLIDGCPWYLRTNSRGVDINRNFKANWEKVDYHYGLVSSDADALTYRGPRPDSEPETRAVLAFLKATPPRAVLSYHSMASITGADFLMARSAEADTRYVRTCADVVEPFVRGFYGKHKRWRAGVRFGASAGSLPEYAYRKLGIPGFDLEWDGNPESKPSHTDRTSISLLRTYQQRHYDGLVCLLSA